MAAQQGEISCIENLARLVIGESVDAEHVMDKVTKLPLDLFQHSIADGNKFCAMLATIVETGSQNLIELAAEVKKTIGEEDVSMYEAAKRKISDGSSISDGSEKETQHDELGETSGEEGSRTAHGRDGDKAAIACLLADNDGVLALENLLEDWDA